MGCLALQRVIVRMLYDPQLVSRVMEDASQALAEEDLTAEERTWIGTADARAWRIDPYRRSRSLNALIEEFPVGSGLVLRASGGVSSLG